MSQLYIRRCPACETENAPEVMRCQCGSLLSGIDLTEKREAVITSSVPLQTSPPAPLPAAAETQQAMLCGYDDCAQTSPPGSQLCLYCNRPFAVLPAALPALMPASVHAQPGRQIQSLLSLPASLRDRFQIVRPLATQGAEAELLLVQDVTDATLRVAKIYRHGIHTKSEVSERLKAVPAEHRVVVFESGLSDGHAYELMEYCELGSLRQFMQKNMLPASRMESIVRELTTAIASVHAVGLIHRDLKPENILLRTLDPLDLVLTDFGISSVLDATQRLTGTARTLPYASPESLSGVIDAKADFWALGMIILELTLGRHPFASLSEAVILHYLTTREIELNAVHDSYLRKLLRGLLLRDPKARWDETHIMRWLARDRSLPDPVETMVMAGFREPYHIGNDICHTKEQLAVGLARNWDDGVRDISNAQLLSWFRDVQKDQNAVRVLLDMRQDKKLSVDVQLLRLILHLAPGIPPVWRGESIELPGILAYANKALKGDEAAASWLHQIYNYGVLDTYADAGNKEVAGIVGKWPQACRQIEREWQDAHKLIDEQTGKQLPGEHHNIDKLMYGLEVNNNAPLYKLHARILALAYDERWPDRLRKRLVVAYAGLQAYCPWLSALGDIEQMQPASLLVAEAMLPEAQQAAERQQKADAWKKNSEQEEAQAIKQEVLQSIRAVRIAATDNLLLTNAAVDLRAALDQYYELLIRLRASGSIEPGWQEAKKAALRVEHIAAKLSKLVDALAVRRAENEGWSAHELQIAVALVMVAIPIFFRTRGLYLALAAFAAVAAWRYVPNLLTMRKIRTLGEQL
ncbi:protein kinase [Undibacterium sp. TS12]|uniref:protein kinase domain-containing protein n=1 Tax=Undibacterium sp. TS12 TaxID=2908202 RepID=UPI001F4C9704|nr:protein kinase [Undibacterium sp. TS12]MCH8621585.1 protein kinase [Undibacterium sp. TS12]